MRMMMKIRIPVEHGNRSFKDGTMQKAMERLMERLKPEAAYFFMENGLRAALLVYEAKSERDIFETHEPLFAELGALIDETPALTWADMTTGFADMR